MPQFPYLYNEARVPGCAVGSIEGTPVRAELFFSFVSAAARHNNTYL